MALLYTDDRFLNHDTGAHPESADRLRSINRALELSPTAARFKREVVEPAPLDHLHRVHEPAYVRHVRDLAAHGGGPLDPDTVVSRGSYDAALFAAGCSMQAVDQVVAGDHRRAVCLVRPPGHHALPSRGMGFCLFNNVALAAWHAVASHQMSRVLIVDWDVHHGNGTQDMFYEDEHVWFFSVHRWPFYPGTGAAEESGSGSGLGTIFNLPLSFGNGRREYRERYQSTLALAAERCRPELVLVSAGFDAHAADPIGSLELESEDFHTLTRLAVEIAEEYCDGRIVSLLEGGYNVRALAESVLVHLDALVPAGTESEPV